LFEQQQTHSHTHNKIQSSSGRLSIESHPPTATTLKTKLFFSRKILRQAPIHIAAQTNHSTFVWQNENIKQIVSSSNAQYQRGGLEIVITNGSSNTQLRHLAHLKTVPTDYGVVENRAKCEKALSLSLGVGVS
jgi:hypothetical protein